ncbi:hypothetical protein [Herbidospora mongoliensis]|uniref:hypothetical protein n=1 Tax=Herbidospora mongoliensis TaxID=688067 RepID=UPI00083039BE|nr:hypothetical protein [Herbidospora mongoliensis]
MIVVVSCGGPSAVPHARAAHALGSDRIPDSTVFLPFRPPGQGYEVKVPKGWARKDLPTGATFTDRLNSVRVEIGVRPDPPGSVRIDLKPVDRAGGEAMRTTFHADSSPDPVTGKVVREEIDRYVFTKGGRQAVLTLAGPVGADNVGPWRTLSNSFRWTS